MANDLAISQHAKYLIGANDAIEVLEGKVDGLGENVWEMKTKKEWATLVKVVDKIKTARDPRVCLKCNKIWWECKCIKTELPKYEKDCSNCKFILHGRYADFPKNSPCKDCGEYNNWEPTDGTEYKIIEKKKLEEWSKVIIRFLKTYQPSLRSLDAFRTVKELKKYLKDEK